MQGPLSPRHSRLTEQQQPCVVDWSEQTQQQSRLVPQVEVGVQCQLALPQGVHAGALIGSGAEAREDGEEAGQPGAGVPVRSGGGGGAGPQRDVLPAEGGCGEDLSARVHGLRAVVAVLRAHASDLAHDLKNPLNGVLALSQNVMQVRRRLCLAWSARATG